MTTYRTPQVGERWRVRPRPSPEWTCPNCGRLRGSNLEEGILTVKAIPNGDNGDNLVCFRCSSKVPMPSGMVGMEEEPGHLFAVPISWLEPLEESPR